MTKTRLALYRALQANAAAIVEDARKASKELEVPEELWGRIGLTGASSSFPGALRRDIIDSMAGAAATAGPIFKLGDKIRDLVKAVYGDDYDAVAVNSCEGALLVSYEALVAPPLAGRGGTYRVRTLSPLERHGEHHLSYGRPFPPRYKDIFADRGATAGELGLSGRRIENLDIVMIPVAGASYATHGIKHYSCPLLMQADPVETLAAFRRAAEIHAPMLGGIVSLGYDTPGYGSRRRHDDGTPLLLKGLSELSRRYDIPYIVDNAWGIPFIGTDPRKVGSDVMLYSMDKVGWGPTAGLVIGRDDALVPIRRALGVHSERWGTTSSHGKAGLVALDPGREPMAGLVAALTILSEQPERVTRPIDIAHEIVVEEYERAKAGLGNGFVITKSYNLGGSEVNYEGTWANDQLGIPIFSHEDRIAGVNLINNCMAQMGVIPGISDDANIAVTPGLGTTDNAGVLNEWAMRLVVRALFLSLGIVARWASRLSKGEHAAGTRT